MTVVFPHITLWKKEKNKNPLSKFIAFIHHMCQAHAHTDQRPACVGIAAGAWKPSTYPAGHSMTLRCAEMWFTICWLGSHVSVWSFIHKRWQWENEKFKTRSCDNVKKTNLPLTFSLYNMSQLAWYDEAVPHPCQEGDEEALVGHGEPTRTETCKGWKEGPMSLINDDLDANL
jgi:hypothetical protein